MKYDKRTAEKKLQSYQRNHADDDLFLIEREKVNRDKRRAKNLEDKHRRFQIEDSEAAFLAEQEMIHAIKKAKGNHKTHKQRYKTFKSLDEREDDE